MRQANATAKSVTSGGPTGYAGLASDALSVTSQLGTVFSLALLIGVATAVLMPLISRPAPAQNRAERTNAGRPVGHPAR